ncbi:MAG: hypothetical protein QM628_15475 [Propionicimonas sp.]
MSEVQTAARGSLLIRVPGRARPRQEVLAEFNATTERLRQQYPPVFWPLLIPEAADMYRWRVRLECGCTHEVCTRREDQFPDERRWLDPVTRHRLPAGEFWCPNDHPVPRPYRRIVEWAGREVTDFPADPEEPQHGLDAETWAVQRRAEPHQAAFWTVQLECGHYTQQCTNVGWQPGDGPVLVSPERAAEIRREFDNLWATDTAEGLPQDDLERDHLRRMIDQKWPRPAPETSCYACTAARRITGYQRIGWLIPKPTPVPVTPPPVDRRRIAARLAKAEAEVERLRQQLADSDDEPTE